VRFFSLNFTKIDTEVTTKDPFVLLKWGSYNLLMSEHITDQATSTNNNGTTQR